MNFPRANHRLHGRPVGRKARGLLSFMHRRGFAVADTFHFPSGIPGVHDHGVTPAPANPEYSSGQATPSPRARSPTRITFSRQPTHGVTKAGRPLQSASIPRGDGRSFRGDPRAPIPAPKVYRGAISTGHQPGSPQTFGYPQEKVSETPSSQRVRHTLNVGAKAPGGVPGGLRRRGLVSPSPTIGKPDPRWHLHRE